LPASIRFWSAAATNGKVHDTAPASQSEKIARGAALPISTQSAWTTPRIRREGKAGRRGLIRPAGSAPMDENLHVLWDGGERVF
jgi:hypothetical protein